MMKEELKLKSRVDGLQISSVVVRPEGEPEAVLNVVHGMCGGKDRFIPFMEYMAANGVACIAHDHRGHGGSVRSSDDLGYMYNGGETALIDDMDMVCRWSHSMFPDSHSFILGHSMGALAVMSYLSGSSLHPDGAILCDVPGYSPFSPAAYMISVMLGRIGLGRMRPRRIQKLTSDGYNHDFISEGRMAWTCSDPEVRKKFAEDPSHNFYFTLDASRALMGLMLKAYAHERHIANDDDMPVLMLYGEDDACAGGPSGISKAVCTMHEHGFVNIGIKTYPAMRHEILNEIGKERVWQDILDFIRS